MTTRKIKGRSVWSLLLSAVIAGCISFSLATHLAPPSRYGTHSVAILAKAATTPRPVPVRLEVAPGQFVTRDHVLLDQGWSGIGPDLFQSDSSVDGALTYRGSLDYLARVHFRTEPNGGNADLIVDGDTVKSFSLVGPAGEEIVHEVRFRPERSAMQMVSFAVLLFLVFCAVMCWALPLLSRAVPRSRRGRAGAVFGLLATACVAQIVLPVPHPALRTTDLRIANAETTNAQGSGAELWVRVLGTSGDPRPLSAFWHTGDWSTRAHGWLVTTTPGSTLQRIVEMSPDETLEIYPTAASSTAVVTVNGVQHELNAQGSRYEVRSHLIGSLTASSSAWSWISRLSRVADIASVAVALALLLAALRVGPVRRAKQQKPDSAISSARWWSYARLPAVVWGLQLLVFWPGIMSSDSTDQWRQLSYQLSNAHPWLLSVALGVTRNIFGTPAAWIALMVAITSAILGVFATQLRRMGASERAVRFGVCVPAIVPPTSLLMITVWKDVPYAIAMLGLTVVLVELALRRRDTTPTFLWFAAMYGTGVAAIACRHNALPSLLLALGAVALLYWRAWRTMLAFAALGVAFLASSWAIDGPIASAVGVAPSYSEGATVAYHIAAHVNAGTPMSEEDRKYLDAIAPLRDGWPYDCTSIGPTWLGLPVDYVKEREHLQAIAVRLARTAPRVEVDHMLCSSRIVWLANGDEERTNHVELLRRGDRVDYLWAALPDTPQAQPPSMSLTSKLTDYYQWWPNIVQRPAAWLYALVLLAGVACWRRWKLLVGLLAVPIAHSLVLMAFNGSQDVRYQSPVLLIAAASLVPLISVARGAQSISSDSAREAREVDAFEGRGEHRNL